MPRSEAERDFRRNMFITISLMIMLWLVTMGLLWGALRYRIVRVSFNFTFSVQTQNPVVGIYIIGDTRYNPPPNDDEIWYFEYVGGVEDFEFNESWVFDYGGKYQIDFDIEEITILLISRDPITHELVNTYSDPIVLYESTEIIINTITEGVDMDVTVNPKIHFLEALFNII
jgi:hypothetical protein